MKKINCSLKKEVKCEQDRYIFTRKKCCGKTSDVSANKLVRVYTVVPTQTGVSESWWRVGAICPICGNFISMADYEIPLNVYNSLPRIAPRRSTEYDKLSSEEKQMSTKFFREHYVSSPVLRGTNSPNTQMK